MQDLWKMLSAEGIQKLCTRNLNQDPIENLFGNIRMQGVRNVNPTCFSFKNSLKTVVVNNFTSRNSPFKNCEDDESDGSLNSLKELLCTKSSSEKKFFHFEFSKDESFQIVEPSDKLCVQTTALVGGYLVRKMFKRIKVCRTCRKDLVSPSNLANSDEYKLIDFRAYTPRCLIRPHTRFIRFLNIMGQILKFFLPKMCSEKNLCFKLSVICRVYLLDYKNEFLCLKHDVMDTLVEVYVPFYIFAWTKHVNRVLEGEDSRISDDPIKQAALKRYKTYNSRKAAVEKIKKLDK